LQSKIVVLSQMIRTADLFTVLARRNDEIAGLDETSPLREADIIIQLQIEDEPVGKVPARESRPVPIIQNPPNDRGTWVMERGIVGSSGGACLRSNGVACGGQYGRRCIHP
jgi:hypothetical protein